jgi:hypothetical protein
MPYSPYFLRQWGLDNCRRQTPQHTEGSAEAPNAVAPFGQRNSLLGSIVRHVVEFDERNVVRKTVVDVPLLHRQCGFESDLVSFVVPECD